MAGRAAPPYEANTRFDALTGGRERRFSRYLISRFCHVPFDRVGELPWHVYAAAEEGLLIEQPWAPQMVTTLDPDAYEGPYRWQPEDPPFEAESQDVHAGDDDLTDLAAQGVTVVDE